MAASGKQLAVGLRHVVLFELLASGLPKAGAVPATPYEGTAFSGPKAFAITIPEARKISHVGEDRPLAVDFLPPIEAMSGELRCAPSESDVAAILGGLKVATVAEATFIAMATSQQGFEPQVGLLLYQQSLDVATGMRRWRSFVIPSARCVYMPAGMNENTEDSRYMLAPTVTTKHLWGTSLVAGTEGCTSMQAAEIMTTARPNIVAWLSSSTTVFNFPTAKQSLAVTVPASIVVWSNGVLMVQGAGAGQYAVAADKITFGTHQGTNTIVCLYEW